MSGCFDRMLNIFKPERHGAEWHLINGRKVLVHPTPESIYINSTTPKYESLKKTCVQRALQLAYDFEHGNCIIDKPMLTVSDSDKPKDMNIFIFSYNEARDIVRLLNTVYPNRFYFTPYIFNYRKYQINFNYTTRIHLVPSKFNDIMDLVFRIMFDNMDD